MEQIHVHGLLISLICDVLINVLFFALMMASFVLGITLGFNLMEETGYLARLSFLFDRTMSKVACKAKRSCLSLWGSAAPSQVPQVPVVVDNWGQRVLAIAMSWAVPCSATLSVVPTIAITLFSSTSGFLAMVSIFLFMFLMMWIVYRVFGKSLAPKEERVGLIMELAALPQARLPQYPLCDLSAHTGHFPPGSAGHLAGVYRVLRTDLRLWRKRRKQHSLQSRRCDRIR